MMFVSINQKAQTKPVATSILGHLSDRCRAGYLCTCVSTAMSSSAVRVDLGEGVAWRVVWLAPRQLFDSS